MRSLSRALVVGGAGFLGSWLVETLVAQGVETIVLDRTAGGRGGDDAVELIVADVAGLDLAPILDERGVDVVFHLAGTGYVPPSIRRPIEDLRQNAVTTLAVLEGARHAARRPVVGFVSSAAVYGEGQTMPMAEDHPLLPVSPYGISKLAAEHYVTLYARMHGLATFSVRLFSLYGPRQRKLVVYDLLSRAVAGEDPLTVLGSPDVSRDFVFVEDAARAFVTLARKAPAEGEAYNVSSGNATPLGELVATLLEVAGLGNRAAFTGEVRPGDPLHWHGDPRRARTLGAECDTPLREGLRRTAEWFVQVREHEAAA